MAANLLRRRVLAQFLGIARPLLTGFFLQDLLLVFQLRVDFLALHLVFDLRRVHSSRLVGNCIKLLDTTRGQRASSVPVVAAARLLLVLAAEAASFLLIFAGAAGVGACIPTVLDANTLYLAPLMTW